MTIDYVKKKEFYDCVIESTEKINELYLIKETLDEPDFFEGNIIYNTFGKIEKSVVNKICEYQQVTDNYKEYLEIWLHEIKTPLASAELIIDNNPSQVTKNVKTELKQIERLLNQVLYYSKSEYAENDYLIKKLSLERVVKKCFKTFAKSFIYNRIHLEFDNLEVFVYSDEKWLNFILQQIITNAIKYLDKDEKIIRVTAKKRNNQIILTIEDNGIGISESDIEQVFNHGFTGENGRIYGESTGMGLYICKKLSDKLNIALSIESTGGEGTKFNIVFPVGGTMCFES
ncbi:sensor histidine kinase [Clostridium sp. CM027]|uniref:sensor histidine kinase n=1 Tax=Clostridium sp. CM027 TaxID=2849865 RepID=UPI00215A42E1|nr:ATP-binding protein [Clostridium sp. CM027]UVE41998.1 sensor histidine kinase [Clostridium sp. CM027]